MRDSLHKYQPPLLRSVLTDRPWARLLLILFSCLAAVFGLCSPYFQKEFIDSLLGVPSTLPWHFFQQGDSSSAIWLLGFAFMSTLLSQFLGISAVYIGAREAIIMQRHLSEVMYHKTLGLRTDTLANRPVGEIVALYATDVQGATILLEQSLPMAFSILFPLILAPIALVWLFDIPLWTTLAIIGAVATVNFALAYRQSVFFYRFKQLAAERTGLVSEWIQNIRTLRILGWTRHFEGKIFAKRETETANRVRMVSNGQLMNAIASSITFFINIAAIASVVWLQPGSITPGGLLALLWILAVFLTRPFRQMPWFFTFAFDGLSSLRRLESYLKLRNTGSRQDERPEAKPPALQRETELQLSVRNLNLTIEGVPLLRGIDFEIQDGEFVAVVGEVGSGKSLLLLSLMGETGCTADTYRIGELNALEVDRNHLRSHFSYVPQEGFVMSATLRENVVFNYDPTRAHDPAIERCLQQSQFDLQAESIADGLDTEIGERGVNLSGGQRQRVSLARANYHDAPFVLIDDGLSAVDVDTERGLIRDLFYGRWKNKTRILVTHRLTVLKHVDRVIFMENGVILDQGSYTELLNRSERFRQYARSILKATENQKNPQLDLELEETDDYVEN